MRTPRLLTRIKTDTWLYQRIGAVIKRRQKQRLADAAKLAQKEARGDYSHLKNKKGEMIAKPLPQPTLPNLSVDDDVDDNMSMNTRAPPPSTYTQEYYNYNSDKISAINGDYPPPMPPYNPYSTHQPPGSHTHFQQSSASFPHDDQIYHQHPMYDEDNESTAHLAPAAAPFSHQPGYPSATHSYGHTAHSGGGGSYDPHDVYQGRAGSIPDPSQRPPPTIGLAYDDAPEYSRYEAPPPIHSDGHGGYPQRGYDAEGNGGYSRAL